MNDQSGENGGGFVARWSRRKTEERERQAYLEIETLKEEKDSSLGEITVPEEGEEEKTDVQELPDIDTLDKDSDYTPFLKDGVPSKLKRLAFRKLWMSDPAFGIIDGLDDYAEDFSAIGIVAQEVLTNYRPGKGMVDPDEPKKEVIQAEGTSEVEEGAVEQIDTLDKDAVVKGPDDGTEQGTAENDIASLQDNSGEQVVVEGPAERADVSVDEEFSKGRDVRRKRGSGDDSGGDNPGNQDNSEAKPVGVDHLPQAGKTTR